MPSDLIPDGAGKARRVRSIVEAKENFVWATCMDGLCDIFDLDNLGTRLSAEMTEWLDGAGLTCFPSPVPSQQQKSVIVILKHSRFAKGFEPTAGG
jgi:hypothetical protein